MAIRMPALRQAATSVVTSGRGGSIMATSPRQGQPCSARSWSGMVIVEVPAGDGQGPGGLRRQLVVDVGHLAPVILGKRDVGAAQETVSHRPASSCGEPLT